MGQKTVFLRKIGRRIGALILWVLVLVWIFPLIWLTGKTFTPNSEIIRSATALFPEYWTLENIQAVVQKWPFFRWLLNSTLVTLGSISVTVAVSLFAAYSFARLQWKGRDIVFVLFLSSMFIPWEINAVPLYFVTKYLGILGTRPGIFLPIAAMPVGMFLLRQFFISIPQDIEDAARIDGCSSLTILMRIFLPMTIPVLGAVVIWISLFAWNEFFWSMISLQRSAMVTLPIGLKNIMGSQNIDYGGMFASSLLALLPSLLIFLFLRRQIIRGITVSGSFR